MTSYHRTQIIDSTKVMNRHQYNGMTNLRREAIKQLEIQRDNDYRKLQEEQKFISIRQIESAFAEQTRRKSMVLQIPQKCDFGCNLQYKYRRIGQGEKNTPPIYPTKYPIQYPGPDNKE